MNTTERLRAIDRLALRKSGNTSPEIVESFKQKHAILAMGENQVRTFDDAVKSSPPRPTPSMWHRIKEGIGQKLNG